MTEQEIENLVEKVATKAVRDTLLAIGLATGRDGDIVELQGDFAYLRKQRIATEKLSGHVRLTLIGMALSGIGYVLWEGFRMAIKGT